MRQGICARLGESIGRLCTVMDSRQALNGGVQRAARGEGVRDLLQSDTHGDGVSPGGY